MASATLSTPARLTRSRRRPWHAHRQEIEAIVERLINILDTIDGDPDLKPNLGAREIHPILGLYWQGPRWDDRAHQLAWARSVADEREVDHGDEPEEMSAVLHYGHAEPDVVRVRRASR